MAENAPTDADGPTTPQGTPMEGGSNIAGAEDLGQKKPPRLKPGPKKGTRPSGRKPGIPNKKTVEREERERIAREAAAAAVADAAALEAFDRKSTSDTKRAKKVLENFMELFAGMAAVYQPIPPGMVENPADSKRQPDEAKFDKYAALAVDTAKALAPFQDPRYSAMVIGATVVTKIKVEGGMPTDFRLPDAGPPIPPLTIISAEDDLVQIEPPKAATG